MTQSKTTVLLADDHVLLRRALARLLRESPDLEVVGEASTVDEALDLANGKKPDVVVLDIDMPGPSAFDAAVSLKSIAPDAAVVFLSGYWQDSYIESALEAGALAYLTKNEPPEEVVKAIRSVASGRTHFSREVQDRLVMDVDGPRLRREGPTRLSSLTAREIEVLRQIAKGHSKKAIAEMLHLSVKTVDKHATNVMSKLNIHDRVQLARFAIREGLVEP